MIGGRALVAEPRTQHSVAIAVICLPEPKEPIVPLERDEWWLTPDIGDREHIGGRD